MVDLLERLDVPVLQAVLCTSSAAEWAASAAGLTPRDTAMNVVLPEFDGRINTVAISFKEEGRFDERLGTPIKAYVPEGRPRRLRRPPGPELRPAAAHAERREARRDPLRQLPDQERADRQRRGARHARLGDEPAARLEAGRLRRRRHPAPTATP